MRNLWTINAALLLFSCAHASNEPFAEPIGRVVAEYTITTSDNFEHVRVHACFRGGAVQALQGIRRGRIVRTEVQSSCADYEAVLDASWATPRSDDAIVVSQRQWLWRPHPFPNDLRATVRFDLPPGKDVSVPWPRRGEVYALDDSAFFADAYVVFGSFDARSFNTGEVQVEAVLLGSRPTALEVQRWLDRAVRSVASIGRFPRERVHFVVAPASVSEDDVLFGMLRRGGGASILVLPSVNVTRAGLERDWVAVHELSHLWLPRFYPQHRWLSEGFATYMQEVLRARCGLQSEDRAWERIYDGFERGRRAGTRRTLDLESRDMDRTGAYHRVYWAGAAFALEADLHLRRTTNGELGLLDAIAQAQPSWSGTRPVDRKTFLSALDAAVAEDYFVARGQAYAATVGFPEIPNRTSPELAPWRAAIMKVEPEACGISAESSR